MNNQNISLNLIINHKTQLNLGFGVGPNPQ